jgi:hypothetical protein
MNVRTLGGARCGAPYPGRGFACNRGRIFELSSTVAVSRGCLEGGDADSLQVIVVRQTKVIGGTKFRFRKAAPWSVYRLVYLRIH